MIKQAVLIIAGSNFLRAYAGTLHIARALVSLGHPVQILVRGKAEEIQEYSALDIKVTCMVVGGNRFVNGMRSLVMRSRIFFRVLFAKSVLVTENTFLLEVSLAKYLRGKSLTIGHFCQELHLPDEMPDLPRARLNGRLARVADFTIDVEPNRARIRQEKLGLRGMPLVLRNTLHLSALCPQGESGGLEKLAGCVFPKNVPILLHMGGVGIEKPLERVIDAVEACKEPLFFLAFCNASENKINGLRKYAESKLQRGQFKVTGPRKRNELLASAWEADLGVIDYSYSVQPSSNQRYCAPTKLYEFMALGLAVAGSNNDSLREVIEAEGIGYCAEGESPAALGRAIERTVAGTDELRERRERSQNAFRERHCYEQICNGVVEEISKRLTDGAT